MDRERINSLRQALMELKASYERMLRKMPSPAEQHLSFFQSFLLGSEEVQNRKIVASWVAETKDALDFNRRVYEQIDNCNAKIQECDEQVHAPTP